METWYFVWLAISPLLIAFIVAILIETNWDLIKLALLNKKESN